MTVIISNSQAAEATPPDIPMRPDQNPYRFEMLFSGYTNRAYADTADELLAVLIRGYESMPPAARLAARLHLAVRCQTVVQADINYEYDLTDCTLEEEVILQGHRNTPPDISQWTCRVPIILVDLYYQPDGELTRPINPEQDVQNPDNILWISPEDPYAFLLSLHSIGFIALHEHIALAA